MFSKRLTRIGSVISFSGEEIDKVMIMQTAAEVLFFKVLQSP